MRVIRKDRFLRNRDFWLTLFFVCEFYKEIKERNDSWNACVISFKKGKILNEFKLTKINLNILEILIYLIFLVLLGIF